MLRFLKPFLLSTISNIIYGIVFNYNYISHPHLERWGHRFASTNTPMHIAHTFVTRFALDITICAKSNILNDIYICEMLDESDIEILQSRYVYVLALSCFMYTWDVLKKILTLIWECIFVISLLHVYYQKNKQVICMKMVRKFEKLQYCTFNNSLFLVNRWYDV